MTLYSSVLSGLAELEPLDARDEAVAELAMAYARALEDGSDEGGGLKELGPKLLACLIQLEMTPAARKAIEKNTQGAPANPLDELKAKRKQRGA